MLDCEFTIFFAFFFASIAATCSKILTVIVYDAIVDFLVFETTKNHIWNKTG